ncbi:MAG: recombinase zinc beta ribbon domain-containing protein, partial [Pseudanabaena sp. M57BS1SP1A06MG]|nr:recombinase zinc beta ribbon domain-containing protein [Pseudanabaena sp. M57BS1SP1A06MG]
GFDNQTKNIHPLSGLVYCGECGRSHRVMGSLQRDKVTKLYYYQCQNYGVRACSQKKSIRDIRVEESAIAKLTSAAEQIANIADSPLELQEPVELRELRSQLATLEAMGSNPAIVQAIGETKAQIAALEYQTISGVNVNSGLREILFETFNNPLYFSTLPIEQKKAIYRALIDRIVVKDGEVVGVELKI